jgi:hypothetical protein
MSSKFMFVKKLLFRPLTDASCSILYHASTLLSLPFAYLYFIPSIVQTVGRA